MTSGVLTRHFKWPKRLSDFNSEVLETLTPGKYLVESIPACACPLYAYPRINAQGPSVFSVKYVPSWFPGASWKRYGEQLKAKACEIADEPFRHVKKQLVSVAIQ